MSNINPMGNVPGSSSESQWQGRRLPLFLFAVWLIASVLVVTVSLSVAGETSHLREYITLQLEKAHIIDAPSQSINYSSNP
ncbi:hypothetical protein M9194_13850 [Vibrio sp. S4M6]|uniref:hypothetical protein n=1 Tax=Vibrio sinus TaxID=2946865 RepID=UPI00202A6D74|nr:hypothetical protein [Vibrio sinus]MCL9782514.1 hypothetical protein [Vibrio sinus]